MSEYPGYTNPTGTAPSSILDAVRTAYQEVDVDRLSNEETGQAAFDGDGSITVFTIPHTLGVVPTRAFIQPRTADAAGDLFVSSLTSTDIEVTFAAAPAAGTDNVVLDYYARVSA